MIKSKIKYAGREMNLKIGEGLYTYKEYDIEISYRDSYITFNAYKNNELVYTGGRVRNIKAGFADFVNNFESMISTDDGIEVKGKKIGGVEI